MLIRTTLLFCGLIAIFSGTAALAHETENRVVIKAETLGPVPTDTVHYVFELLDTETNAMLGGNDLSTTHEKKLHFFAFDPALVEFQHVHPVFDGKSWGVDLKFTRNGEYWLWAQGTLVSGGKEFFTSERLSVQGGLPAWPTPPLLADTRSGEDGNSVATLDNQKLRAGQMAMLILTLTRKDGSDPAPTPYLGAFAHITAVTSDGDSLIHVHPMGGSSPSQGMVHATFPTAGFYRLWIQFMDAGEVKTTSLSVQVF